MSNPTGFGARKGPMSLRDIGLRSQITVRAAGIRAADLGGHRAAGVQQDGERVGQHGGGADTRDRTADEQEGHVRCRRRHQRADREQPEADEQDPLAPEAISGGPAGNYQTGEDDQARRR